MFVRVIEPPDSQATLVLAIQFARRSVLPQTDILLDRGFNLVGLDAVGVRERHRRGRILAHSDSTITVITPEGESRGEAADWDVSPSTEAFLALARQELSEAEATAYNEAEWQEQATDLSGQNYTKKFLKVATWFESQSPRVVAPGISVSFGPVCDLPRPGRTSIVLELPPTQFCFSDDRVARHTIPAKGLDDFGPFDNLTFFRKQPSIVLVCPADAQYDAEVLGRLLQTGLPSARAFRKGFLGTYRLASVRLRFLPVTLPRGAEKIGDLYVSALRTQLDPEKPPDVAIVVLRDEDAFSHENNPYLATKAYLMSQGIPVQELRLSKLKASDRDLPYILEDFCLALYAKLGGTPWTITPTMPTPLGKEIIIGLGYAEVEGQSGAALRYMGITTVFTSDGTYQLAALTSRCRYEEYPETLAKSVSELVTRLTTEQAWRSGDTVRLIFHSRKPLRDTDTASIISSALASLKTDVHFQTAFLTLRKDHPYKVVDSLRRGQSRFVELSDKTRGNRIVGECVPDRGIVVDIGANRRLLCLTGAMLVKREGEPLPDPMLVELHDKSDYRDLHALTRQVFNFTGLSWKSMRPSGEPATLAYSKIIAELLGKIDRVPGWSDALINTKLRQSRWFL
jgi:hypothetical protein